MSYFQHLLRRAAEDPTVGAPSLQLDASVLGLANGASVPTFTDSSASANHATQGTGSAQPTFIHNGQNSLSIVRFGAGKWMSLTSAIPTDNVTVYFVGLPANNSTEQTYIAGANNGDLCLGVRDSFKLAIVRQGQLVEKLSTNAVSTSAFSIFTIRRGDASHGKLRINGADEGTSGDTIALGDFARVGCQGNGITPWLGDIGEIRVYPVIHNTAQMAAVEAVLDTKWGI